MHYFLVSINFIKYTYLLLQYKITRYLFNNIKIRGYEINYYKILYAVLTETITSLFVKLLISEK